jgi:hypothetical protein
VCPNQAPDHSRFTMRRRGDNTGGKMEGRKPQRPSSDPSQRPGLTSSGQWRWRAMAAQRNLRSSSVAREGEALGDVVTQATSHRASSLFGGPQVTSAALFQQGWVTARRRGGRAWVGPSPPHRQDRNERAPSSGLPGYAGARVAAGPKLEKKNVLRFLSGLSPPALY